MILLCNNLEATVDVDLSGVNLQTFDYFRYPTPSGRLPVTPTTTSSSYLQDRVNRGFSILQYFRSVLVGTPWLTQEQPVSFDPNAGKRNAVTFQRQFGRRGENLIALLGAGYSPDQLAYYGAVHKK